MLSKATVIRTLACMCAGVIIGFTFADTHPHALMSPAFEMIGGGVVGLVVGLLWSRRLDRRAPSDPPDER